MKMFGIALFVVGAVISAFVLFSSFGIITLATIYVGIFAASLLTAGAVLMGCGSIVEQLSPREEKKTASVKSHQQYWG